MSELAIIYETDKALANTPGIKMVKFEADWDSNEAVTAEITGNIHGRLISAYVQPKTGGDAPDGPIDFELRDPGGWDFLKGAGSSCSNTASSELCVAGLMAFPDTRGTLWLNPTGSAGGALGQIVWETPGR